MAIGPVGQVEAPSAGRPVEGHGAREANRIREDLQQNVPVKDVTGSSSPFPVPADADQQVGGKRPSREELAQAVKTVNDYIQSMRRELQFNVDDKSDRVVIKVVDTETKEVIRQIPPKEVLALSERLSEDKGLLLRTDV